MSQSDKSSPATAPLKRGKGVTGGGDEGGVSKFGQGGSGSGGLCMPDPEKIRKMALDDKDKGKKETAKTSGVPSAKAAAPKSR